MADQKEKTNDESARQEVVSISPKAKVKTEPVTAENLQAMSDKDVDEYLASIATGKIELTGLEEIIHNTSKETAQKVFGVQRRLQQLKVEQAKLETAIHELNGQMNAYTNMLVLAEDSRRAKNGGDTDE